VIVSTFSGVAILFPDAIFATFSPAFIIQDFVFIAENIRARRGCLSLAWIVRSLSSREVFFLFNFS